MAVNAAVARPLPTLIVAIGLAWAAAISLGLARFSYALLLPPMRADLGWSYFVAGAMNTVNAAGYLAGALLAPLVLRRLDARRVLLGGGVATGLVLIAHALVLSDVALYALRFATGVSSAAIFVSGGLLAARLTHRGHGQDRRDRHEPSAGLVLGVYYGGAGAGIVISTLLVPPLSLRDVAHAWQMAWAALGVTALLATGGMALVTRGLEGPPLASTSGVRFTWRPFACGLVAYFLFGFGYIGYMTFVVTLLREQRLGDGLITGFYGLLGLAVVVSSWLWAGLLQRQRGGLPLALLNALLAAATLLPVLSTQPLAVFASGLLFGGVFLSVVASTTALVRHNLPPAAWPGGISAFTIVFAAGQIVGPALVGRLADGAGGLRGGLASSAAVLLLAAVIASFQRPLPAEA
jgi:predicted MFS family arabinose efflux permease